MLNKIIPVALMATISFSASAQELKTENQKLSYFLGAQIGQQFKSDGIDVDKDAFFLAVDDVMKGKSLRMSDAEMNAVVQAFQKAKADRMNKVADENKKAGEKFLAENKTKKGVKVTASGLQYKVVKSGSGKTPAASDTVEVHYHGTLIDGTVFDSSVERGQPASFPVGGVIRGWTEALQLMKEGDKWTLYIPSDLAYGPAGTRGGPIGPNAALVFEVELLKVK